MKQVYVIDDNHPLREQKEPVILLRCDGEGGWDDVGAFYPKDSNEYKNLKRKLKKK